MFEKKLLLAFFLTFRLKMKCKILEYDRMCSSVKVLIFRNEKQGQFQQVMILSSGVIAHMLAYLRYYHENKENFIKL